MITTEFVMQKLAEPFDARDVAKPLKDEPLTRPLYNEYMRDSRKPKAPALPPRVQMQVGTQTLNQQRMDQDVASFGERLGVNSMGGSDLGMRMNQQLSAQQSKAADEEAADAKKTVRKITPATVNGVSSGGRGRGGKNETPAVPSSKNSKVNGIIGGVIDKIRSFDPTKLGVTQEQIDSHIKGVDPDTGYYKDFVRSEVYTPPPPAGSPEAIAEHNRAIRAKAEAKKNVQRAGNYPNYYKEEVPPVDSLRRIAENMNVSYDHPSVLAIYNKRRKMNAVSGAKFYPNAESPRQAELRKIEEVNAEEEIPMDTFTSVPNLKPLDIDARLKPIHR